MKKILFIESSKSTFIKDDLDILKKHFQVKVISFSARGSLLGVILKNILNILKIVWYMPSHDAAYVFFASHPALFAVFFARLFRKKAVVVPAGYTVVYVPEIDYGLLKSRFYKRFVLYILNKASLLLPISEDNQNDLRKLGIPELKSPVIYLGLLEKKSDVRISHLKEKTVLTVGEINTGNFLRKGQKGFVEAAALLPKTEFIIAGKFGAGTEDLKKIASSNVRFIEFPSNEELEILFNKSSVYVQASCHESFGLSIAEAMLHKCVPVVTDRAAIPEVVGDTGFYVEFNNPESIAEGIKKALQDNKKGELARKRILTKFSMEEREAKMIAAISALWDKE